MSPSRAIVVLVALGAVLGGSLGCGSSRRAARPVGGPVAGPPIRFQGVIGGRAFVGQSAVMLPPVQWNDGTIVQELLIFERPMTCAEADAIDRVERSLVPGEHVVSVELPAPWPAFPGSVWSGVPGPGGNADMRLVRRGDNGAPAGDGARGEMRVLSATPATGTVSLRVDADRSDPFYRDIPAQNLEGKVWGSASGEVTFVVCRR